MSADPTPTSTGQTMILMRDVEKHFGSLHVLKNIQLEVPAGQVVIVIGPSGSGKSTLCRTINRLEPIDSGRIEIDGTVLPEEGKALAALRSDVGMLANRSQRWMSRRGGGGRRGELATTGAMAETELGVPGVDDTMLDRKGGTAGRFSQLRWVLRHP